MKYGEIESWLDFSQTDKAKIDYVENELFALGAKDISNKLQYYRGCDESNINEMIDYFKSNQEYLEKVILDYIVKNIDKF